jgi:hypothetical protein
MMPLARTQTRSRSNNNKMVKIIIKKLIKRAVAKDHSQASLVMEMPTWRRQEPESNASTQCCPCSMIQRVQAS